ncbi:hypothetical protein CCHOA_11075 [Corynebacterium choanae]|uniref:Uncharacterized protein n=1 Tax=Corynebacterium choanae TaxID=1862358 RepID=A0A3G6J9X3_9CORY|nr:hypothetical protein CCHOA_11075 [Corynebacterium choanae]
MCANMTQGTDLPGKSMPCAIRRGQETPTATTLNGCSKQDCCKLYTSCNQRASSVASALPGVGSPGQLRLDEQLSDLDGVECSTLAQIIPRNHQYQSLIVGNGLVLPDTANQ